ncbi:hypothetical protein C8J57DRAFT_233408 [Mycena rebaudengoi]|nr:hypothetical protein C8J57DRAFT_233408 [Mycena rebaudengoi]
MAMVPKPWGPMRIIALPLTQLNASRGSAAAGKMLTFYNYKIIPAVRPKKPSGAPRTFLTRWLPDEGVTTWASNKWATFGTAEKGTMKLRAFQVGERLMDRLDFEESNLKTIDVSTAPSIRKPPTTASGRTVEWTDYES